MSDNLAAIAQTRLRKIGSNIVVHYRGGGWYRIRRPGDPGDGRSFHLGQVLTMIDHLEREATKPNAPPMDKHPSFRRGWKAFFADEPREPAGSIHGPSRGLMIAGWDAAKAHAEKPG